MDSHRYKSLINALPFCVHEIGLDGHLISMNSTGLDMINQSDVCAVPYLNLVAEKDLPRIRFLLEKAKAGEESRFEFEGNTEDNIIFSSCFIPIFDAEGKQYSILGYTQDITQQRHAEKDLSEQVKRLALERDAQLAFSNLNYSETRKSQDIIENILQISASVLDVERISLWQLDEKETSIKCIALYLKSVNQFEYGAVLKAVDYPEYFKAFTSDQVIDAHDAHADPRTKEFSEHYLSPLGINSMLDTVVVASDHFKGVLCSEQVGDKRDWKIDEIAFSFSASFHISRCIRQERKEQVSAELHEHEQNMFHTQKLESLGVLAGGIAHDFNSILTTIMGNADLALLTLPPHARASDHIAAVKKGAVRAADLAQQMLAYAGKSPFIKEVIEINPFIEDMLHLLKISISKNAVLKLNLAEALPAIEVDKTQLRQIIMNLVINASDAIAEKSGVISVSTGLMYCDEKYLDSTVLSGWGGAVSNEPESKPYLFIEVSDNGCGIDAESIVRIFDPFYTTKFAGRGLGLAAALGIVKGHEGSIKVYSEKNVGTTFKILLPKPELNTLLTIGNSTENANDNSLQQSGAILVVDDEEAIRGITRQLLESVGFKVLEAANGREALTVYLDNQNDIKLVLMDLTMPHMDGEEAFRELRRINDQVKVVLCSGFSKHDIKEKFSGKGVSGYLQKPFTMASIIETITSILSTENS